LENQEKVKDSKGGAQRMTWAQGAGVKGWNQGEPNEITVRWATRKKRPLWGEGFEPSIRLRKKSGEGNAGKKMGGDFHAKQVDPRESGRKEGTNRNLGGGKTNAPQKTKRKKVRWT